MSPRKEPQNGQSKEPQNGKDRKEPQNGQSKETQNVQEEEQADTLKDVKEVYPVQLSEYAV